jgi:hypothetical protein
MSAPLTNVPVDVDLLEHAVLGVRHPSGGRDADGVRVRQVARHARDEALVGDGAVRAGEHEPVDEVEVRVVLVDAPGELEAGVGEAFADLRAEAEVLRPRAGRLVGVPLVAGAVGGLDFGVEVEGQRARHDA